MKVELKQVCKRFGAVEVVKGMDMTIEDGEFVAFLGPSGCGKTTTLLLIAGIYQVSSGVIEFAGKNVSRVPPKERDIGMVFQSYALYPHMSVYENMVFPLKLRGASAAEMRSEAERLASMLGLDGLFERKPAMLSGGQQQRVAIARALIKKPGLLLFDEPLSNLDARLRMTMRAEIKRLQRELGITSIYVTHDQVEAMTMADRIAVMQGGVLEAFARPQELHDRPVNRFIAEFIGNPPMNFLPVELVSGSGQIVAEAPGLTLAVPAGRIPKKSSGQVILGIRPQSVTVRPAAGEPGADTGAAPATVELIEPLGRDDLILCRLGEHSVRVLAEPDQGFGIGDRVHLDVAMDKCHWFDPKSGVSLL